MFRVVLPVDSDEERARVAADTLANLPCADSEYEVAIVNVFQELRVVDDSGGEYDSEEYFEDTEYPSSVSVAEEILDSVGVTVSKYRRHGDPEDEILDFVDEIDANHIVMAGHDQTPIGKLIFGSVAQEILLNSNVPVTIAID